MKITPERKESLTIQLLDFARTYPEGFTLDLRTRKACTLDYGYLVAIHNENTGSIPATLNLAEKHNLHLLGGWWNEKDDRYEFDVCTWFETAAEAVAFGKAQKQLAIFDCFTEKVINLEK